MEDDEFVFIENDISQSTWVDVKKSPTLNKQPVQQQEQPTLPVYRIVTPLIEEEIVPQQVQQVQQSQVEQNLEPEILQVKEETIVQQPLQPLQQQQQEQQVPVIVSIIESPLPISLPVQQQDNEPEWLKGKEKTNYTSVIPSDVKYTSSNVSTKPYITTFSSPTSNRTTTSSSAIGSGMRRISLAQLNGETESKPYTSSDSSVKSFTTASKSNNSYSYAF